MKKVSFYMAAILAAFTYSQSVNANSLSTFEQAFNAYNEAYDQGQVLKARPYARESYYLGCEKFGNESANCANLAVNFIHISACSNPKLENIYQHAFGILDKKADPIDAIDLAMNLLSSKCLNGSELKIAKRQYLLEQAESLKSSEPLFAGLALFAVAKHDQGHRTLYKKGVSERAYDLLVSQLPAHDLTLFEARFILAKVKMRQQKRKEAIQLLETNVALFEEVEGNSHPFEMASRAFLVRLYSAMGNEDIATEHCVAIGNMRPWDPAQAAIPLFRSKPVFPIDAAVAGLSGYVILSFSIDEKGFVTDVEVLKASDKIFKRNAKKALEKWRYAPRFVDGKAVVVKNRTVQLDFMLGN